MEAISSAFAEAIRRFTRKPYITDPDIEELIRDIQRSLLKTDVPVELVLKLSEAMREAAKKEVPGASRKDLVVNSVYSELTNLVGGEPAKVEIKQTPSVWLFVGIQGFGKTTTLAKVALFYRRAGKKVAVICADTFRPGAFDQLRTLLEPMDVLVLGGKIGESSLDVIKNSLEKYRSASPPPDLILVDTAGRHKDETSLMEELSAITEVTKPDASFLVIDAAIGQRAKAQAEAFAKVVPIAYVIITKMDGTAKGGGALATVVSTGAKIPFIGTGEDIEELEPFVPMDYVSKLIGVADLRAIIERVSRSMKGMTIEKAKAFALGRYSLEDFVDQMDQLKGSDLSSMISRLIPVGAKVPKDIKGLTEGKVRAWKAIINSMNQEEKQSPNVMNPERIRRVARGSGRSEREVRELLDQYKNSRKLVKKFRGLRGIPGVARF